MKLLEIKKGIYWVGAVDWNVRDFHGYSTWDGTTYNSYLMVDDKITLFDGVKNEYTDALIAGISEIVDPARIDYLVVNHVEPDHSGAIPKLVEIIKPEKIFCSDMGRKSLLGHYHHSEWPYQVVKSGDEVMLGRRKVIFQEARMLHWPDSMLAYLPNEKLLISNDAFGEHLATTERFDDEVDNNRLMQQAAKYYANILWPYSPLVQKIIKTIVDLKWDFDMIAPDHGVVWRKNPGQIIAAYAKWSEYQAGNRVLVVYESMWKSTEKMAARITQGLADAGMDVRQYRLEINHRSDIVADFLEARGLVLGSPTLNNQFMPQMADFLSYLQGLKPGKKVGAAFGSYGWSGEAVRLINEYLKNMNFQLAEEGLRHQWVPTPEALQSSYEMGGRIAQAVKDYS
jgi:flavorubredoxin